MAADPEEARDFAESIVETVREPLLVLGSDLRVKKANRSFYRTFQVTPEETDGQYLYRLGNGQWDLPPLRRLLEEILPGNTVFDDFEVDHVFPAIGRRVMMLNARRVYRELNHTELILLAIEDITARRRAEEDVRELESRYTSLVQNIRDHSVFMLDAAGHITSWNRAAEQILGYSEEEILGRHFSVIFLPEDIARGLPEQEMRLARDEGRAEDERWHLRKGGEPFWALGIVTPMRDAAGTLTGFSKILRDMTERKRAEELLHRQAAALQETDRRKDEFLAMLSHELRNPMAALRNAAQILGLVGPADARGERAAAIVERQVAQMSRLIDDLLDVSRITQGKITLQTGPVDLSSVAMRALETSRPVLEQRRHQLAVALCPGPVLVQGDLARLTQVLSNLLDNSAKYTDDGGSISLTVERRGAEALLRVRDNGMGISAEMLPHVFDLFTQGNRSLARSEGGLGIGLAMVKRLVELHGGRVEVASEGRGQGSEVVVTLPLLPSPEPAGEPEPDLQAGYPAPGLRILVVDDSRDSADGLAMLLQISGCEVWTAYSGQAALESAAEHRPDVVLLDLGLPQLDGYEVARRLREDPRLEGTRLVAVTGYGQEEDRSRSREAGFAAHLVKPVDLQKLQEVLAALAG